MNTIEWNIQTQIAYSWCKRKPEWSRSFEEAMADIVTKGDFDLPPVCRAQIAYTIWTLRKRAPADE